MSEYRKQGAEGRYDPKRSARMPANGLARPPISVNVKTALAVVPDPMEPGKELYVAVNRRVDILETERSHKRISEGAYRVGREIQAVFEKASRVGSGSQWREGDRVDQTIARELAIHRNIETARAIQAEMERLVREVGSVGALFLRCIIGDGVSFKAYAEATSGSGRRDVDRVADRFRWMLEEIVRRRAARGPVPN